MMLNDVDRYGSMVCRTRKAGERGADPRAARRSQGDDHPPCHRLRRRDDRRDVTR